MKKILVSYGYGAGWYSWNSDNPDCLTNATIISMVEAGASPSDIEAKAKELWEDGYWGGSKGLEVVEIYDGVQFCIDEYDGAESIRYKESDGWLSV